MNKIYKTEFKLVQKIFRHVLAAVVVFVKYVQAFGRGYTMVNFTIVAGKAIGKRRQQATDGAEYDDACGEALVGKIAGAIVGERRCECLKRKDSASG